MSKRESDGEKKEEKRKKQRRVHRLLFILASLEIFLAEKVCLTQEAYLAKCFSKKTNTYKELCFHI